MAGGVVTLKASGALPGGSKTFLWEEEFLGQTLDKGQTCAFGSGVFCQWSILTMKAPMDMMGAGAIIVEASKDLLDSSEDHTLGEGPHKILITLLLVKQLTRAGFCI